MLLLLHRFQPGGSAVGVDAMARGALRGGAEAAQGVAQGRGTSASVPVSSGSESESEEFRSILSVAALEFRVNSANRDAPSEHVARASTC